MPRTHLLGATTLCVALMAAACSVEGISSAAEPPSPSTRTPASTMSLTTTTTLGASQDVTIRLRDSASAKTPQRATLQIPANPDGVPPIVVLLHGAGGASIQDLVPMADAIVAMGIPVLNASWLANHRKAAESVADAVCAVAYAYQNATSWGGDPDRIIVIGHSGGGQVGMLAGLAPEAFPECATASEATVWAYIGLAGDPASTAPGGNLRKLLGDDPELLERMDSYNHIGANPGLVVRFVHGTSDVTVPIELTRAFHDTLISAGYDSELIPINGAGHLDPTDPTTEAGLAALNQLTTLIEAPRP